MKMMMMVMVMVMVMAMIIKFLYLFPTLFLLAHNQVSAFELSFHGVSLIKGCSLYQGVSYIGVLFAGVFFFSPFFDEFLLIPGCSLSRQSLN